MIEVQVGIPIERSNILKPSAIFSEIVHKDGYPSLVTQPSAENSPLINPFAKLLPPLNITSGTFASMDDFLSTPINLSQFVNTVELKK